MSPFSPSQGMPARAGPCRAATRAGRGAPAPAAARCPGPCRARQRRRRPRPARGGPRASQGTGLRRPGGAVRSFESAAADLAARHREESRQMRSRKMSSGKTEGTGYLLLRGPLRATTGPGGSQPQRRHGCTGWLQARRPGELGVIVISRTTWLTGGCTRPPVFGDTLFKAQAVHFCVGPLGVTSSARVSMTQMVL